MVLYTSWQGMMTSSNGLCDEMWVYRLRKELLLLVYAQNASTVLHWHSPFNVTEHLLSLSVNFA